MYRHTKACKSPSYTHILDYGLLFFTLDQHNRLTHTHKTSLWRGSTCRTWRTTPAIVLSSMRSICPTFRVPNQLLTPQDLWLLGDEIQLEVFPRKGALCTLPDTDVSLELLGAKYLRWNIGQCEHLCVCLWYWRRHVWPATPNL